MKMSNNKKSDILESTINKLIDSIKILEVGINNIDEKLNMIIKRQNDIEDKILFRIEKKTNETNSSSFDKPSISLKE